MFITGALDDAVANLVIAQMLFLHAEEPGKKLDLYINSPGGVVQSGLAIYDTMQLIGSPVYTWCIGLAASMGALLLGAGEPGHRYALPNCRIVIHQPHVDRLGGQATDIDIQAREMLHTRDTINQILAKHTGQPIEKITHDADRDFYMSGEEAKAYGLVDEVVVKQAPAAPGG
jgi:ATP-dependent Clp protease protease subunit